MAKNNQITYFYARIDFQHFLGCSHIWLALVLFDLVWNLKFFLAVPVLVSECIKRGVYEQMGHTSSQRTRCDLESFKWCTIIVLSNI